MSGQSSSFVPPAARAVIKVVKVNTTSQRVTSKCNGFLGSDVTGTVILLATEILQANVVEYCPARDMLLTDEISNIAYEKILHSIFLLTVNKAPLNAC